MSQSLIGYLHEDGETVTAQVVTWGHPFRHVNFALNEFYAAKEYAARLVQSGPIHFLGSNLKRSSTGQNAPVVMSLKDFANARFPWRFLYDGQSWKVPVENLDGGIDLHQYPFKFVNREKIFI